jgi:hypothetical protein
MSVKIQLKRTTASAWTSLNPTLDVGETGYETDTAKFKIGNGSTAWTSLAYANANLGSASLDALADVTITSAANGDFLRWNGTAWINDAVNLGTDTTGSFVASLVAGTGVTLTNNSGEDATPTVAIGQDVASSATPTFAGLNLNGSIIFEGATANEFETTLSVVDPTADRTVSLPDASGTLAISGTIALGTDTTGNYVSSLVAGTGIALSNNSGESATPTVALNATIDNLSDVTIGASYSIGDTGPAGGKIFITPSTSGNTTGKYFEVSPSSATVERTWSTGANQFISVPGGTAVEIGTGEQNTINIVAQSGNVSATSAAVYASEYTYGGYSDWFLPSKDELNQLAVNKDNIGGYSAVDAHWASSEESNEHAYVHDIGANAPYGRSKDYPSSHVRPIRSFTAPATPNSGDFLKYNGTAWVNDPINLGTDTVGGYVASLVAGTGVTLTNNSGETATPTIAIGQAVATNSNVTFNDLTVSGNLTVSGTTTSINTETLTVDDNVVVLNNNVTGSPTENAGIEVERGTSANVLIRWNETNDKWEVTNDGTVYGNIVTSADSGTVTSTMIADGTIVNGDINASAAIADTKLATISSAGKVSNSATTATDANTASAIVARDASGNFTAGTITAALSGNASTATTLATARNIAGQSFNGSANISIAPTDLTGVTSTATEINILDGATLSTTELNYVDGVTSAIQTQLDAKAPLNSPTFTGTVSGISKSMVGLTSVDDTSDANKPVSTAQQTAIDLKANLNAPTFTGTVSGISKSMVGLGNLDNTSDVNKPISTATQNALDLKAPLASPTFTGTPSLPTGTTAVTQTLGNNTTAVATTAFIQTALANFGGMTVSDTAPTVDVSTGDFWYDSTGLNLYIYYSSSWVQVTIDEPIFFELSELIGVVIGDLLPNQTLRFDGVSGNWVNSSPRQNISNSSLTTYGVTSANSGNMIVLDSSSAVSVNLGTWTDANVGEKVDIVQKGTGQVTVTVSGSVSVVSPGNSVTTRVRYSTVTATCISANLFLLSGDLA